VLLVALEWAKGGKGGGCCALRIFERLMRQGMAWYGMVLRDLVGDFLRSGTDTFEVVSVSRSDWRLRFLSGERVLLLVFVSAIDLHDEFDRLARFCHI
jgi:hypothetical protein